MHNMQKKFFDKFYDEEKRRDVTLPGGETQIFKHIKASVNRKVEKSQISQARKGAHDEREKKGIFTGCHCVQRGTEGCRETMLGLGQG
jgi:hypothetical protein